MFKNFFKKFPLKLSATVLGGALGIMFFNDQNSHLANLQAGGFNYSRRFYPASSEYPDITKNRNIMSRCLDKNLYAKLRDLRTSNGFTLDEAIQTGVDNVGKFSFTGIVAGDGESYDTFKELIDKIILEKHNFKPDQKHITDLDESKIQNFKVTDYGVFDPNYVKSIRIRTLRNIKGYCFPSFCTRGERRDIESLIVKALYNLDSQYKGTYYALKDLSKEEEATLMNNNIWMDRPFYPTELSANLGKDWPDARGIWLNDDKTLAAFLNRKDHLLISVIEKNSSDFTKSFVKFVRFVKELETQIKSEQWDISHHKRLGFLTTDPKNLGTALKISVRIKLPHLSKDARLSALLKLLNLSQNYKIVDELQHTNADQEKDDEKSSIIEITSYLTLGKSEIEIAQMFIESIHKLIEAEKLIESGQTFDSILYSN